MKIQKIPQREERHVLRLNRRTASVKKLAALLAGVTLIGVILGGEAWARGLSVGLRVQQDNYKPLIPVTRNFRTCFHVDANGTQVLGICTGSEADRMPASSPSATPSARPSAAPIPAMPKS